MEDPLKAYNDVLKISGGEAVANEMPFVNYPLQGGKWVCPDCAKDIPIINSIDDPETFIPIKDHMKYEHNYTDNQVENVLGIDYHSQQAHKNNLYRDGKLGKSYFGGKWYDNSDEAVANEMPFSGGSDIGSTWTWTCPSCSQPIQYDENFIGLISDHLRSHGYSDEKIRAIWDVELNHQRAMDHIIGKSITSEADNYPQKQQMSQADWNDDLDDMRKTFGGANDEIEEEDGLDEDRVEIDISGDDVEIEDFDDDEEDYFDDDEESEEFAGQGGDDEPEMEAEWKEVEDIANEYTLEDLNNAGMEWDNSSIQQRKKIIINTHNGYTSGHDNNIVKSWNELDDHTKSIITDNWSHAFKPFDEDRKAFHGLTESYANEGMVYKNDVLEEIKLKPNSDLSYLEQMLSNFDDGDMTVSQAIQELQEEGKIEWTGRGYSVASTESYAGEDYGMYNVIDNPNLETHGYPRDEEGFARASWDDATIEDRKNWLIVSRGIDPEIAEDEAYKPYFSLDPYTRVDLMKDLQIGGIHAMGTGYL